MKPILFQYRSRKLHTDDIAFIKALIDSYFLKGRSYISRELCKSWNWVQPNGKLKEYAARDLLLRLEEQGLVALPGRIRPKNNLKPKIFDQIPLFVKSTLGGTITGYEIPTIQVVKDPQESYLWGYLLYHYHYLGCPRLVGEHVRHIVHIGNQVVACLGWASAAWKVKDRDRFIGWDETTKRTHLHLIASNVRFLIPPWVTVKHLASKVLSLALKRLSDDWEAVYGHPVYLAETFVDTARFQGTCYQAANWLRVGKTKGSAKRGNTYRYHGQTKELYLYPLEKNFRRLLAHDQDEARAILEMNREDAIQVILILAGKAEKYDRLCDKPSPTTPSGMTPPYLKPTRKKRKRPCGRKPGHKGVSRRRPETITAYKTHTLERCPDCQQSLQKPVRTYKRYIEDIPRVDPVVTEHTVHGYWCACCKKIVQPALTDALPNARLGLRLVVFTAWLHYVVGISVNNLVKMVSVFFNLHVSAGGLTQAWKALATLLEPQYNDIGQKVSTSAVLHADETGWRLNGKTHWLWCFTTKTLCYYLITRNRGSPVIKRFLGRLFKGILICDFWGAYNKTSALAKQRCFYHLFTELVKVDTYNHSVSWKSFRRKLSRLLRDAIRLSEKKHQINPACFLRLKNRLYCRLEQFLATPCQDKDAQRLTKRLNRHKQELFTFLEHEDVSPYNNHAEQQMRKPVLTRKVSQQNRSEVALRHRPSLCLCFVLLNYKESIQWKIFWLAQKMPLW